MRSKQLFALSLLCAMIVSGCMSLEERLVSPDPTIKRNAEYELVNKAHGSGNLAECIAAVERVSDRELLRGVALQTSAKYAQEGVAAVKKLKDQDDFKAIATGAHAELVAAAAYMRINDQTSLLEIAKQTKYAYIRRVAAVKISDKKSILPIVISHIQDNELIEKFISNCKDEKVLCELINNCGDKLPATHVAKIQGLAKTQELKDALANIEDIRIGNELKIRCSGWKYQKDAAIWNKYSDNGHYLSMRPGTFVEQFRKIKSLKVRNEVLPESLEYLCDTDSRKRDTAAWKEIASLVDANCIMRCQKECKGVSEKVECLLRSVNGAHVPEMYALLIKDGGYASRGFFDSLTSQEDVARMLRAFPDDVRENDLLKVVSKIDSSEAAEAFLSRDFISKREFDGDMKKILKKMLQMISLVGDAEKQRVLKEATHDEEFYKDKIGIGPFYLGMPYYEAIILAENEGLRGKSCDIWFGWDDNLDQSRSQNAFYKSVMKDWKKTLVVTSIGLSKKGSVKYLDCEDAVILQQAIKQCVKKEAGKAKQYEYMDEIKHNARLDSSNSFDMFSPNGIKTDYRVTSIEEYSSTKLGVRLRYVENDGILVFLKTE